MLTAPNGSVLFTTTPTQWLSVPNSTAFLQQQPFTYEGWFYPTNATNTQYLWQMLQQNWIGVSYKPRSGGGMTFAITVDSYPGGTPPGYATQNQSYPNNVWYHVALVCTTMSGSSAPTAGALYINGVAECTWNGNWSVFRGASTGGNRPLYIGQYQNQNAASFRGYISNFRVVKGTAVYTETFTPPTSPLTAITNTVLLLNTTQNANFLTDSSTSNFTVTNNGSITSSALNPF